MKTKPKQAIGIMADSHGQFQSLARALIYFKEHGCETFYHLGDICDSAHPENADRCVNLLRDNNAFGIKGNNDHQVVVNHKGRPSTCLTSTTIEYLQHLPLAIELGNIVMAHSLPFIKERGLSSMVGVMGPNEAGLFFETYPGRVLLRGHGHQPEILRQRKRTLVADKIDPGQTLQLAEIRPCIITCGALDQGFLMMWRPDKQTLTCQTVF